MPRSAAFLLVVLAAAGCARSQMSTGQYTMTENSNNMRTYNASRSAPLDPTRPISQRDCRNQIEVGGGNLLCE